MENIKIKLTRDKYNFRFKQYEGTYFHGEVKDENMVKYKITKDEAGLELKEFGNTHIKDNMIFIPQIDAYFKLKKVYQSKVIKTSTMIHLFLYYFLLISSLLTAL